MSYEHTQIGYVTGGALTTGALLILYPGFSMGGETSAFMNVWSYDLDECSD